jgi:ATP-dependent helicase/nuclease subunit A
VPVWRARKEDRDARCQGAAEAETRRERDERLRLLYVALTRARDRLYVTGWRARGGRGSGEGSSSWHELLRRALADVPDVERFEVELGRSYRGDALRLRRGVPGAASQDAADRPAAVVARPCPLGPPARPPRRPRAARWPPRAWQPRRSRRRTRRPGVAARERIRHGLLVHRLLQVLPGLPAPAGRMPGYACSAGWRRPRRGGAGAAASRDLGVLRLPDLAALFGPGSRPEQPVCGLVGGQMVAGQVDRLAVTADAV